MTTGRHRIPAFFEESNPPDRAAGLHSSPRRLQGEPLYNIGKPCLQINSFIVRTRPSQAESCPIVASHTVLQA
jgi:hypothetical protein